MGTSFATTKRVVVAVLAWKAATLLSVTIPAYAQTAPKPATEATKAANRALQEYLNFNHKEDFENATRGLILTLSKEILDSIQLKQTTIEQAILSGALKVEGRREAFAQLMGLLDSFPFWFNIVSPNPPPPIGRALQ